MFKFLYEWYVFLYFVYIFYYIQPILYLNMLYLNDPIVFFINSL